MKQSKHPGRLVELREAFAWHNLRRTPLGFLLPDTSALDFRLLGRMLVHAALIGLACGLMAAAFFAGLEWLQSHLLDGLAGYVPLRAHGEELGQIEHPGDFRPWLLPLIPMLGALGSGFLARFAPEIRGGGGDAAIEAFHEAGGVVRRRVAPLKLLASILTLGSGGAGGREGPTMQMGAALGSSIGRLLKVNARERRILLVAGIAAGISGVFRTPLGAALLAVEILYRDDFESEALIPALLSSVLSYSVVISIFGESILFARPPPMPFVLAHLPLHIFLAVLISILAVSFLGALKTVRKVTARLPLPLWMRPGVGGLLLGLFATAMILLLGPKLGLDGRGLGILGGGYGAAQTAITGSDWLPGGWVGVELLLILCGAKLIASSLTIGTGASAGDFAPSMVMGGLLGGAFGRAASLLLNDPRIQPGAFALVGMGAFYGGVANVPVSALILVSEMAGSYDLLVPSMLAVGCSYLILRKHSLYGAQVASRAQSPAHNSRGADLAPLLGRKVAEALETQTIPVVVAPETPVREVIRQAALASSQALLPVVDAEGLLRGHIRPEAIRYLASDPDSTGWMVAVDLMEPPVTVEQTDELELAVVQLQANDLRALCVVEPPGKLVGLLDEKALSRIYLGS